MWDPYSRLSGAENGAGEADDQALVCGTYGYIWGMDDFVYCVLCDLRQLIVKMRFCCLLAFGVCVRNCNLTNDVGLTGNADEARMINDNYIETKVVCILKYTYIQ